MRIRLSLPVLVAVLAAALLAGSPAQAQPAVDPYGGFTGITAPATGRFRTAQIDGVWWLITPDGNALFSAGIVGVRVLGDFAPSIGTAPYQDNVLARYGTEEAWAAVQLARLLDLRVTTIGAWSRHDLFVGGMPYTPILLFAQHAPAISGVANGLTGQPMRDYFAPAFAAGATTEALAATSCATDPWCIGVFTDNELGWGPGVALSVPLLDGYVKLPAGAPGKLALQSFFAARHADVAAFNAVWGTALASFDDVQTLTALPADWGTGPAAREADRHAFTGVVAQRYFQTAHDALRAIEPAMLILGARFLSYSTPPEVVLAAAPYVDVLSTNYYELDPVWFGVAQQLADQYGFVPAERMFDDVDAFYAATGKPILIGEFGYRSAESDLPNTFPPFYPTLATQAGRADAYARYMRRALQRPYVVGAHWFKHADQPIEGRADGENNNWGIVDLQDDPYVTLGDRMRLLNAETPARRLLVPGGTDARAECLVEWAVTAASELRTKRGITTPTGKFTCTDGDPTCDLDGLSGQCVFELAPCAAIADARVPTCTPEPLVTIQVTKPSATREPVLAGALTASLAGLVGPAPAPGFCGRAVQVVVPLGSKRRAKATIGTRASSATRRDVDKLRLTCQRF